MPIDPSEVNRINFESKMEEIDKQLNNNKIEVLIDPKQDIAFWLNALSNPNIDRESKEMLNKCLYFELNNYLNPPKYAAMYMGKPIFE